MEAGTSPISSRKTVPVSACSNLPGLVFIAPVKAPFSNPNSSLSIRFSGRAVQLIFTNGASASGRIRGALLDGICQNRYAALRSPTFGLLTIEHSIRITTLVKIHRKGQMTLPTNLRSLARITAARLAESDEDTQHGRTYGPFNTAEEMASSIEASIRKLRAAKKRPKPA